MCVTMCICMPLCVGICMYVYAEKGCWVPAAEGRDGCETPGRSAEDQTRVLFKN